MDQQNVENNGIKFGIANYSPLDFDSYIDKSLKRTLDPSDCNADVLYTRKIVETDIKIQVVFNDQDFLTSWGLLVGDVKSGKKLRLTNELTDKLIKG